jgi:RNA polymerase sigma-70 factor (ECF subfamily)
LSVLSETVAGVDFAAFYRAERRPLVRFVMFLGCADADAAEDIAQTAFVRAFPVWETIRFSQAWLRKVAQNEFIRYGRAAGRVTSLEAVPERAERPAAVAAALAVEQQADTREVLAAVIAGPANDLSR